MFDILCVELDNFRTYRGIHKFETPATPGLYLISGINETEPRLGSNGAGKSTLLDAIFWCLYGRTPRGLKAADVISWGESSCGVKVKLAVGAESLVICRRQSPNSLTFNNNPISQDDLQKRIRLGPDAFTYAVLLPQFGDSFFDLKPADKLTLFSQIMELDYWLEKSTEAATLAEEINQSKLSKEMSLKKHQGKLEIIAEDIKQLQAKHDEFAAGQAKMIADLKEDLATLITETKSLEKDLQFAEDALKGIEIKINRIKAHAKTCPTCKQPIDNPGDGRDLADLNHNREDFSARVVRIGKAKAVAANKEQHFKSAISTESNRRSTYQYQITDKQSTATRVKSQLSALSKEIASLNEDHAAVSFWVNGFKRIRLFIIEQTLQQLEIEVNNNMASLGLTSWRIEFDVERENKSGGITKGFVVQVYPPDRTEPVRLEAWSGGETQRLRLAGDLGLANLIMERAGLTSTIEFYDEPSRHLSQEGLLDVAETLNQRALDGNKRILLIDHAIITFDFKRRFLVKKGTEGSFFLPE